MSALVLEDLLSLLDEPSTPVSYSKDVEKACWAAVVEGFRKCLLSQTIGRADHEIIEAYEAACILQAAYKSEPSMTSLPENEARQKLASLLEPHLRDIANIVYKYDGEALLEATLKYWIAYRASYHIMHEVLQKLALNQAHQLFLHLWVKWVIDERCRSCLLDLIEQSRSGRSINISLIKGINVMLREVGMYDNAFEQPMLRKAEEHFAREARDNISKLGLLSYAKHVQKVVDAEKERWLQICSSYGDRSCERIEALARLEMLSKHRGVLQPSLDATVREMLDSPERHDNFFCIYCVFRDVGWAIQSIMDAFHVHLRVAISRCVGKDNVEWREDSLKLLQDLWCRYAKIIVTKFCENAELWRALFREISSAVFSDKYKDDSGPEHERFINDILRRHPSLQEDHWGRCLPDDVIRLIADHANRPYKRALSPWCSEPLDSPNLRVSARMVNSDWCRAMSGS